MARNASRWFGSPAATVRTFLRLVRSVFTSRKCGQTRQLDCNLRAKSGVVQGQGAVGGEAPFLRDLGEEGQQMRRQRFSPDGARGGVFESRLDRATDGLRIEGISFGDRIGEEDTPLGRQGPVHMEDARSMCRVFDAVLEWEAARPRVEGGELASADPEDEDAEGLENLERAWQIED